MIWILLLILLVLAIGAAPVWPYSRDWGYYPSGLLGLLLVVLLLLVLTGVIDINITVPAAPPQSAPSQPTPFQSPLW